MSPMIGVSWSVMKIQEENTHEQPQARNSSLQKYWTTLLFLNVFSIKRIKRGGGVFRCHNINLIKPFRQFYQGINLKPRFAPSLFIISENLCPLYLVAWFIFEFENRCKLHWHKVFDIRGGGGREIGLRGISSLLTSAVAKQVRHLVMQTQIFLCLQTV